MKHRRVRVEVIVISLILFTSVKPYCTWFMNYSYKAG